MHFLVDGAIVCVRLGGLPALFMLATIDLGVSGDILTEIEAFSGVNFTSNTKLEVFVGNDSVLVGVELFEQGLELGVVEGESPVLEVELQFCRRDGACLLQV